MKEKGRSGRGKGYHSVELKEAAVKRMEAGESPTALAKELGVIRKLLYYWQGQMRRGQKMNAVGRPKKEVTAPVVRTERLAELERLAGRQQLELAFFSRSLAAHRSVEPAGERPWRNAIFAEIRQIVDAEQISRK